MFAVYGANTQRNARYIENHGDEPVICSMAEARKRKMAQVQAERKAEFDAKLAEQRRIANEAVARGREAARRFQALDNYRCIDVLPKIERERFKHSFALIEARTCKLFGVTRLDLHSTRRQREIAFARQFLVYWAARLTSLSYPAIGKLIGGRDHTTALHSARVYPAKRRGMGRTLKEIRR